MKILLSILIITFIGLNVSAQKGKYQTDFDTLEVFKEKILVHYKTYLNNNLIVESTSFLYPKTHKLPRYQLTGNLIKVTVQLDSIVRHGTTKRYFEDGTTKVIEYVSGQELSSIFYDKEGKEISHQEFLSKNLIIGPCGTITGEYFIHGRKK
jgi:antitoxin component YwqK of YwqJK toxin-antitoxin module